MKIQEKNAQGTVRISQYFSTHVCIYSAFSYIYFLPRGIFWGIKSYESRLKYDTVSKNIYSWEIVIFFLLVCINTVVQELL